VTFPASSSRQSFLKGANCVRVLSQSGLHPSNCRLIDGAEAALSTGEVVNTKGEVFYSAILLLAFESDDHKLDSLMKRALEIVQEQGGLSEEISKSSWTREGKTGDRSGVSGKWGDSFKAAAYNRDIALCLGGVHETFETAITWDKFEHFHQQIITNVEAAIKKHCGSGTLTCRFTHVYPDGPAPYYTVHAEGDLKTRLQQWRAIKEIAMKTIIDNGGTCTHHHAVGRMHRPFYEQERGALFGDTLAAIKTVHDPQWILNPGVLINQDLRSKKISKL